MERPISGADALQPDQTGAMGGPKTRACSNCARLKMKCQWPAAGAGNPGGTCARCTQKKLPCHVPVPPPRKKRGKGTKVTQLEQKIDGLVSLFAAGQQLQASGSSPLTPDSQDKPRPNPQPANPQPFEGNIGFNADLVEPRIPEARTDLRAVTESGNYEMIPGFELTADQAESYLEIYRTECVPRFPFVVIPSGVTASALFAEDSSLFWAIMSAVAPLTAEVQLEVKTWFRQHVSDHVVTRRRKRLGLLQAILVFVAWSEFHYYFESQMTPLLELARSLIIDLKLDKPFTAIALPPRTLLRDVWDSFKSPALKQRAALSLDEKRALLGYYHKTSLVTALFKRGHAPIWTSHFSHCCDSLAEAGQYESDHYLAALVNLQRLVDRALSTLPIPSGSEPIFSAPLDMAINNVRREVGDLIDRQPQRVKDNKLLRVFYYTFLIRLCEPVIAMQPASLGNSDVYSCTPFQRAECIWKGLQAAVDYYDTKLAIPAAEVSFQPSTVLALTAFNNVTISRMLIMEASPDWDPDMARRRLNFNEYLTRMSEQYSAADRNAIENGWRRRVFDDGMIALPKFSEKLGWIAQWYVSKLSPEQQAATEAQSAPGNADSEAAAENWVPDLTFEDAWQDMVLFQDPRVFENIIIGPF